MQAAGEAVAPYQSIWDIEYKVSYRLLELTLKIPQH